MCETWELDGSGRWVLLQPATNKSAYAKHWRLSVGVFLSSQNEQYETHRVRGDFPLVNRSRMVSLSRVDKKKCKR